MTATVGGQNPLCALGPKHRLSSAQPTTPCKLSGFRNSLKVVNGVRNIWETLRKKRRRDAHGWLPIENRMSLGAWLRTM